MTSWPPCTGTSAAICVEGWLPSESSETCSGEVSGVTGGRDPFYAGMGDLSLGIIGFISHLPHSMPVAPARPWPRRNKAGPGVALTFTGDGATSAGLFHETLNLASVFAAPFIVVVENNQYAYSTPLHEQMKVPDIAAKAAGYDMPGVMVDGNDVEAVYAVVGEAVRRARSGGGPSLIEAKTMRMRGHAIHDSADYVPSELLAEWEARDPVETYHHSLVRPGSPPKRS